MTKLPISTISASCGEFTDVSAEAGFSRSQLKQTQAQLRTALLFCSVVYLAFIITDVGILGFTGDAMRLLIVRTSVALSAAAGCWLSCSMSLSVRSMK